MQNNGLSAGGTPDEQRGSDETENKPRVTAVLIRVRIRGGRMRSLRVLWIRFGCCMRNSGKILIVLVGICGLGSGAFCHGSLGGSVAVVNSRVSALGNWTLNYVVQVRNEQ